MRKSIILFKPTSKWFYTETSLFLRVFLIFVKGDLIILLPFLIGTVIFGLLSYKWMLIILFLYAALRFLGEMIYWLLQQFGEKKYRPYDFGFTNLDNNAIYIIYQTFSLVGTVVNLTALLYVLFN